jgi:hypothetical protein
MSARHLTRNDRWTDPNWEANNRIADQIKAALAEMQAEAAPVGTAIIAKLDAWIALGRYRSCPFMRSP